MFKFSSIIPLSYFKKNSIEVCADIQLNQKTIVLTRFGKGILVLQNLENFQYMSELAEQAVNDAALRQTMEAALPELNDLAPQSLRDNAKGSLSG